MANVTQTIPIGELVMFNVAATIPTMIKADGTNGPVEGYAFADGANEMQAFTEQIFLVGYGASNPNITAILDWYGSPTTGAVVWGVALQALTPGDAQSLLTDTYATEVTGTTTVNGTANGPNRTTIAINQLDGAAPNDSVRFRITRRSNNGADTMASAANLVGVTIQYPDV